VTFLASLLGTEERAIQDKGLAHRWATGDDAPAVSLAGVRVTRESAMQLSAVWACVSLISDSISTLPMDTFYRQSGARKPFRPRPVWVLEPNPDQERHQWVGQQLLALLLDGTACIYTVRDTRGDVLEAWNVPPWNVTIKRKNGKVVYDVHDPASGMFTTLDRSQMFHISAMSWPGQLRGMAPLDAARHMLGAGLGAQEFAERFYGQGMNAAGIVQAKEDLTIDQAKELKQDFQRMTAGMAKAHLPAVLTNGAEWKPMTVSPEQAQFLETRAFSVNEIARFFRVAPHMIADVDKSTSWGTGIESQGIGFVTYTLGSWIERLEQGYSRHMLSLGSQAEAFVKFNVNGLMRGDIKTRYESYAIGRQNGWLNADEVRALEDQPPLPDDKGQEFLRPANMTVVGETPAADPTPSEGP
jgi:HK97 family phage portal protein